MIFTGNPGTGKTTVARIIGKIFREMGLLSKGHFIEVSRADLVGQFIGSSEAKTEAILKKAMGGVLFIDEAYSLTPKDPQGDMDFGNRVIEVLIQAMENYRDDLIVIAAGYTDQMQTFLDSNPGLKSRFSNIIQFDDYTGEELYQIFQYIIKKERFGVSDSANDFVKKLTYGMYNHRSRDFGNGREIRSLVEDLISAHADRIAPILDRVQEAEKDLITIEDCAVIERMPKYAAYLAEC